MTNPLRLAILLSLPNIAAATTSVDFRTYWCEDTQSRGSGAGLFPYGYESRTGIFDHSQGAAKTILLACSVEAPPKLQVTCRALRGNDNTPEPMPPVALTFGTPKTIPVTGDGGQKLTLTFIAYESGTGPDFGPYQCPFSLPTQEQVAAATPTVVEKIQIPGIDPEAGDPEIWVMSTGALNLHFQAFPPTQITTEAQTKPYETFAAQLEQYIGAAVSWEDRELFYIAKPQRDTMERIKVFVQAFPVVPPTR